MSKNFICIISFSMCLFFFSCVKKDSDTSSAIIKNNDDISYYKVVDHYSYFENDEKNSEEKNKEETEEDEEDDDGDMVFDVLCKYSCNKFKGEITVDNVEKVCSTPVGYVTNLNVNSDISSLKSISEAYDDITDPNVFSVFDTKNEYRAKRLYIFLNRWTDFTFKNIDDFNKYCSNSHPIAIEIKNWLRITINSENAFKHRSDSTIFTPVLKESTWVEAKNYCESLHYQGKSWSLPSIDQLQKAYDTEIYKIGSLSLKSNLKSKIWSNEQGEGFLFRENRIVKEDKESKSIGSVMCVRK